MATRPNQEREFVSLGHIIAEAQAHKPAERVILQESLSSQLDRVIATEHRSGILYSEAVREFKKKFILTVLEHNAWNQCRAARELGFHRNTLSRTIAELKLNIAAERRKRD